VLIEPIDVYIDADPEDDGSAEALRKHLKAAGFRGDLRTRNDVRPGDDFAATLTGWVGRARVVVLLWSADCLASADGHQVFEAAQARGDGVVIAVVVRACDAPRSAVPLVLPDEGCVPSTQPERDAAWTTIARTILDGLDPGDAGWLVADATEPHQPFRRVEVEPSRNGNLALALARLPEILGDTSGESFVHEVDKEQEEDLPRWPRTSFDLAERWTSIGAQRVVGRSPTEVKAKLARLAGIRTSKDVLNGWDGRAIDTATLAPWRFELQGAAGLSHLSDKILAACYGIATEPSKMSGVLILGPPGCGKSLLSRMLERRFLAGPLSALGLAVRRSVRDVATALLNSRSMSIAEALAGGGGDVRFVADMLRRRRLILILDGLDEIGGRALGAVADMLRASAIPFLATTRHVGTDLSVLPVHVELRIDALRREDALALLRRWDRHDLATTATPRVSSKGR
jgi:hypothetical protein